jgi:alkyl sulfatase BDS1-like metallo-beta-lactamase superfamily hydrolase
MMKINLALLIGSLSWMMGLAVVSASSGGEPAAIPTQKINAELRQQLPWADRQDFADVQRGFIAPLPDNGVIRGKEGQPVWDLSSLAFIKPDAAAPDSVNPSLWRQSQLLMHAGLFKVVDRVYQVRGADASNITFIEGDTGLIVVDPLISTETARTALALYYQHRPQKPVKAVIYRRAGREGRGIVFAVG